MENKDITVVIPVHHLTKETKITLTKAIESVFEQVEKPDEIVLVIKPEKSIEEFCNGIEGVTILKNTTSKTDFASQINFAAKNIKTTFFSVLEFDDYYNTTWIKRVKEYVDYFPETDFFLPIVYEYNKTEFSNMVNEAAWAGGFAEKPGSFDLDSLLELDVISLSGMVIKTNKFNQIGGFKSNIKYYSNYEFALRSLYNNLKHYVIPKFGYQHVLNRKGSVSYDISNADKKEIMFWHNTAKKEYYFKEDRQIAGYVSNN